MWLHGRPARTVALYGNVYERLAAHVAKPLEHVTVRDLQSYADSLEGLKPRTVALHVSALKSLLTFAQRIGFLTFNVGTVIRPPKVASDLSQRILPEEDIQRMLHLEPSPRNRVLLDLLYFAGLRVGEVVMLCWRDTLARHRPSLAKSQRACRQSLAWGKRGRAKLARIYHRPINSNFLLKIIGHVPVLLGHFD